MVGNLAEKEKAQDKAFGGAFRKVSELMQEGIDNDVFPGAVLLVGRAGEILYFNNFGVQRPAESKEELSVPMQLETVFDIAGLTQIVATTTLIMQLLESHKMHLDDKVSRFIQSFVVHGKGPITIEQLLHHTSGFTAWYPFFEELAELNSGARMGILTGRGAKEHVYTRIHQLELEYEVGEKQIYSDVGYMLLAEICEILTGVSFDRSFYKNIARPLGMKSTSFIDLSMIKRRGIHPIRNVIAPTEDCAWRKRVLCGEVHDDNTWAMGGVAGHAGLFSSAYDLHIFATEMLKINSGRPGIVKTETLRHFWNVPDADPALPYKYGWSNPSELNEMTESKLSSKALGACGFTGCSLWLEPEKNLDIILMSNRVHPSRSNKRIMGFRPKLHAAIVDAVG